MKDQLEPEPEVKYPAPNSTEIPGSSSGSESLGTTHVNSTTVPLLDQTKCNITHDVYIYLDSWKLTFVARKQQLLVFHILGIILLHSRSTDIQFLQ